MEYNVDVFRKQFPIVKMFLYHSTCYRELNRINQDLDLKSEFWKYTIDAHILQAVVKLKPPPDCCPSYGIGQFFTMPSTEISRSCSYVMPYLLATSSLYFFVKLLRASACFLTWVLALACE